MSGDYRKNWEQVAILFDHLLRSQPLLQIEFLEMFWQSHLPTQLASDLFRKRFSWPVLAVHDEDTFGGPLEITQPAEYFGVVSMRRKLSQHFDFCTYIHHLAMNLQLLRTFQQGTSSRTFCLVTHKQHGVAAVR